MSDMTREAAEFFFDPVECALDPSGASNTIKDLLSQLAEARGERRQSDPAVSVILDLSRRHLYAAQQRDPKTRARVFALLKEVEWAYPKAAERVEEIYPTRTTLAQEKK